MSTRQHSSLTAAQKRSLCEAKEKTPNLTYNELAKHYQIGRSTVSDILKEKTQKKKFRGPKWPKLEEALGLWVDNALAMYQDIDGNILKEKAKFFAEKLNIDDFGQSEGWLSGFKKRCGLRSFKKHGESASAPSEESMANDRAKLQQLLSDYELRDIWNADETGLFWKMEPARTLARSQIAGHKKEKARVTIFCAINASGTEKMKLSFIHKYKAPRAMKNLNYNNLPVYYFWNKKSWMQVNIFNDILVKLNNKMRQQNRNILLLVDNAPVHIILDETLEELNNIRVEFLPKNTTAFLQPCDAGIINSFKCKYKQLFVQNRINAYDDLQNGITKKLSEYNVYHALLNAAEAWAMVTPETIINCWNKTGILPPQEEEMQIDYNQDNIEEILKDEEDDLENLIVQLSETDLLNAREYICIENSEIEGSLTDDDILEAIADENEDEIEQSNSEINEKVSCTKAEIALDTILKFLYEQDEDFGEVEEDSKILRRLHRRILRDIITNLARIHSKKYLHRDLHSGNILLKENYDAYITDLGLSKPLDEEEQEEHIHGVLPYLAPELFQKQKYTQASDIYSFGIIMVEMTTGQRPFNNYKFDIDLVIKIYNGLQPKFGPGIPDCYIELANQCMDSDTKKRPKSKSDEINKKLPTIKESLKNVYISKAYNLTEINKSLSKLKISKPVGTVEVPNF
ncbi:DDE superfamily endonuclease-domain-containing protein [Gigaspora rosea]|uniref:DDE superfamily endonuclease-domain-containing protein n=1 Tax=Gigaspora rosea TaxID=44941 RepID=A0A397UXD3_9GLOM|nr:DDE superfamily endonuclease-domain-containing protein [Gigaspora rosea]